MILSDPRMRPWLIVLVGLYAAWFAIEIIGDHWLDTLARWPIALVMVLGSYLAGSTPMGGGTVGFPLLVLAYDFSTAIGRNFGLCVQATGMTSATIFILCRGIPIEKRLLRWAILGSALGLLLGTFALVPRVPPTQIKLLFACLWASFGVLTLAKNAELCAFDGIPAIQPNAARSLGFLVGVLGGTTTSLIGVGVDMMVYTALVLLFRMDLKVAVPTAVIGMAMTSVMGIALHLALGDIEHEVVLCWLAVYPIVIVGAPIGAFLVSVISREKTLYIVAVLCVLQFMWTVLVLRPSTSDWLFIAVSFSLAAAGFVTMYRVGLRRAQAAAD